MELKLGLFRFAPGFLLLLIAFAVYSDIAVPFIVSALIHEVGHLVVLLRIKAGITKIEFNLSGISICYDGYRLSYGQEIICTAAGPVFSLALSIICAALGRITGVELYYLIAGTSLTLFIFNILPLSFLDGGKILALIIERELGPFKAERISCVSDLIFSSFFLIFSVLMILSSKMNATLFLISVAMIILCCKKNKIGVKF